MVALLQLARGDDGFRRRNGRDGCGGRRGRRRFGCGGEEQCERLFARNAVARQPVALLEIVDGFSRAGAVNAVRCAGQVAEGDQPLLNGNDAVAGRTATERLCEVNGRACHGLAVAAEGGGGVEENLRVVACYAVHFKPIGALEYADGCRVIRHADAVGTRGVITQRRQTILQPEDGIACRADTDDDDVRFRDGFRGGCRGGCRRRGRRGGDDVIRRDGDVAEQHLIRAAARYAVAFKPVARLEGLECADAGGSEYAVRRAGQVTEGNQTLLNELRVAAAGALADSSGRGGHGLEGRGGRRCGDDAHGRHGAACVGKLFLRFIAADAVCLQPVCLLERLDSRLRVRVIGAADAAGVVAQRGQPRLDDADEHALVMQRCGGADDGGKRPDVGLGTLRVLWLAAVEQRLQIRVRNAVHGQGIELLEGDDRLCGGRAERAVDNAGEEAKLLERLLQRGDLIAGRAGLQHLIGFLCQERSRGCGSRCGSGHGGRFDNGQQSKVFRHTIAGLAVVGNLRPIAADA